MEEYQQSYINFLAYCICLVNVKADKTILPSKIFHDVKRLQFVYYKIVQLIKSSTIVCKVQVGTRSMTMKAIKIVYSEFKF